MTRPLVVDLDESLLKVDSLYELAVYGIRRDWKHAWGLLACLSRGKLALKEYFAVFAPDIIAHLPPNREVLKLIESARSEGRDIVLATASGLAVAREASRVFGPFSEVFASGDGINLKGQQKAQALVNRFGQNGFDYVGNSTAYVIIWQNSSNSYSTSRSRVLTKNITNEELTVITIGSHALLPNLVRYLALII